MNNVELNEKVKEILEEKNFFDMMIKVKEFEKEYKNSDFYKETKMPLVEVIKNAKTFYMFETSTWIKKVQTVLNNLDFEKVNEIIDKFGDTFAKENADITEIAKSLDLKNFWDR